MLTYIGMHYFNTITEMNPLMIRIMELPFISGLSIRIIQSAALLLLIYFIYTKDKKYYKLVTRIGYVVYSIVMLLHINWLIRI